MSKAPILIQMERRTKIAGIIRECLRPHSLESKVDETELLVCQKFIFETNYNEARLSRAVLDAMFPREVAPCTLYHYTSLDGLKGIVSSSELRLRPIRNRLGQGGELEAFATAHNLKGYLDSSQGEPFLKALSDDLFYISMTPRVPPGDPCVMWGYFACGAGARLEFVVQPKAAELRPIQYQQVRSNTLLQEINKALTRNGLPPFVPRTISWIGAFYLSSSVQTEDEVRLLIKRYPGGLDPTASDGTSAYWPVPVGMDNPVCDLDLVGIHVAPSGTKRDVEAAIAGTAFGGVPVTGP